MSKDMAIADQAYGASHAVALNALRYLTKPLGLPQWPDLGTNAFWSVTNPPQRRVKKESALLACADR